MDTNSNDGPIEVDAKPVITRKAHKLSDTINDLTDLVTNLVLKLESVLKPEKTKEEKPIAGEEVTKSMCDLAIYLESKNLSLQNVRKAVIDLLDRLQV